MQTARCRCPCRPILQASDFVWHFPDGTSTSPGCAIPNGAPARWLLAAMNLAHAPDRPAARRPILCRSEDNELQTIVLVGDAGGWRGPFAGAASAARLEIVGELLLSAAPPACRAPLAIRCNAS